MEQDQPDSQINQSQTPTPPLSSPQSGNNRRIYITIGILALIILLTLMSVMVNKQKSSNNSSLTSFPSVTPIPTPAINVYGVIKQADASTVTVLIDPNPKAVYKTTFSYSLSPNLTVHLPVATGSAQLKTLSGSSAIIKNKLAHLALENSNGKLEVIDITYY